MKLKFKVGDKARCKMTGKIFTVDSSFITISEFDSKEVITFVESSFRRDADRYELVEEDNMKTTFKEGDMVRRKKGTTDDSFWKDSVRLPDDGIYTVKRIRNIKGYDYIVLKETHWEFNPDNFELVEENKNMTTYTKLDFKIEYSSLNAYFICIPMGQFGEDSLYLQKTGKLSKCCGKENFHKTAESAGKCLDKYFAEVKVTKKQIAEKFGCREDQLTIV